LAVLFEVQPIDYVKPEWFVRMFCGLEDEDDLIADVAQALVELR
jgi:cystathionine beta-lyase/cystathionine gamma-synthase